MAAMGTPICEFGRLAPNFVLRDANGKELSLADVRGEKGTLVMFICNHCPYVKAVADRISRDASELQGLGIGVVAVMPNDYTRYPEDAPEQMKAFARRYGFTFPYLIDESQKVAREYDAVCTPDFFGYNADLELQYRGRLDESGRQPATPGARRELFEAMRQVAETGRGPNAQVASMGCSIKWREDA